MLIIPDEKESSRRRRNCRCRWTARSMARELMNVSVPPEGCGQTTKRRSAIREAVVRGRNLMLTSGFVSGLDRNPKSSSDYCVFFVIFVFRSTFEGILKIVG